MMKLSVIHKSFLWTFPSTLIPQGGLFCKIHNSNHPINKTHMGWDQEIMMFWPSFHSVHFLISKHFPFCNGFLIQKGPSGLDLNNKFTDTCCILVHFLVQSNSTNDSHKNTHCSAAYKTISTVKLSTYLHHHVSFWWYFLTAPGKSHFWFIWGLNMFR